MASRIFWKLFISTTLLQAACLAWVAWVFHAADVPQTAVLHTVPLLVIFSLAVCWSVAQWIAKPASRLTAATKRMAAGEYESGIYLGRNDEFGQLAAALNSVRQAFVTKTSELNRLSSALSAMTDGIIALDEKQFVQFANQSAGRLLEFSPESAQGRPFLESVRSYKLHELVTRLIASKARDELEMEWGENEPKSLFISATYFADKPSAGIIMTISNLSEIHHLQSMRRDFVANVSHELKTPLSSIKAYAETLQNGALEDENIRGRFVGIIHEQADRLNQLISDLLSLARIEQGKTLLELRHVPVQRVVETCINEQRRAADDKRITLVMQASNPGVVVYADEDGLRQILVNLVDNAIKYTPDGGKVIVAWEQARDHVQIYVEDTGLGIPQEMQERVFERFFRIDKARSRELGGTGLGLSIVKHLAQSFGGTVDVSSNLGEGSRFTISLPSANP